MKTQYTRTELKANPIYKAFELDQNNPSKYLEQIDLSTIEGKIIYYWICENDMTLLTDAQKSKMSYLTDYVLYNIAD